MIQAQLKKKPTKKKKTSDEEDNTYTPSAEETKKLREKRKEVQSRVIPRNVRARKGGATLPKDQVGKKEKHVETSKVLEAKKDPSVEIPKEPEMQNVEVPVVKAQQKAGDGDDYVEITGFRAATPPPPPPPQDHLFQKGVNLRIQRIKIFLICLEIFLMLLGYTKMILVWLMILMCLIVWLSILWRRKLVILRKKKPKLKLNVIC
ncbi:hypothetical protein Hanom_Chr12g01133091 [Helianthus anomalus]